MGAFSQGITVTTIYATLGMDAVVDAVIDNLVPVLVCNKKDVSRLLAKLSSMPTLKTIVYISDLVAPNDAEAVPNPPRGVTVISFEGFCASGDVKAFPPTPPKKESTAVVMYTSGSTVSACCEISIHRVIVGPSSLFATFSSSLFFIGKTQRGHYSALANIGMHCGCRTRLATKGWRRCVFGLSAIGAHYGNGG